MDGETLYQMYQHELLLRDTSTDNFDQLDDNDQLAWTNLAAKLMPVFMHNPETDQNLPPRTYRVANPSNDLPI